MRHAVIMAGGAGVRLWPLSRKSRPKQTLRLFEGKSLLRRSFDRIVDLIPPERIHIITTCANLETATAEVPEIPHENLIAEPVGRDTANAVGLAAAVLQSADPEAVIGIFTADHIIQPAEGFRRDVERAYEVAEQDPKALVTLGVRPTHPDTGYGYLRRGDRLNEHVYKVAKFTEKPSMASAMKYVSTGEYFWNSGMFVWRATAILDQIAKYLPQNHAAISEIAAAWKSEDHEALLNRIYPSLLRISIDFGVMERADHVLVVELDCHWVDVGSWPAMEAVIEADAEGNVLAHGPAVHLGSRGNIVVTGEEHLVATIGVDDLVIVHSADATLICRKRDAQAIKELVDNISQQFGEKYL